jgi:hypothetical protein
MSPSPDEAAKEPQVPTADAPPAPAPACADSPAPKQDVAPLPEAKEEPPKDPPPPGMLTYTLLGFLLIGVAVWLIFAWSGYKEKYAQQNEGWRLGATKMLEITLIRDDKKNLACSSDREFEGVHCGFHANGSPFGPGPEADPLTLQPYNTVKNELFLAAGLWHAPILKGELPKDRFTVACNYHILGVVKAVSLRWSPTASFNPVDQSVTVGKLTDCVIPQ